MNNKLTVVTGGQKNLIFNSADFNSLAPNVRAMYKPLVKNTWALNPSQMRISKTDLPYYLSETQYQAFKGLVQPYYRKIQRGFGAERAFLWGLKPSLAFDLKQKYTGTKMPADARISEEQFYKLPAHDKIKYRQAKKDKEIYYYKVGAGREATLSKQPIAKDQQQVTSIVRPPTVGIKKAPMGRWLTGA